MFSLYRLIFLVLPKQEANLLCNFSNTNGWWAHENCIDKGLIDNKQDVAMNRKLVLPEIVFLISLYLGLI